MGVIMSDQTATIPAGATGLSQALNLGSKALVSISVPAAWVSAALTFLASYDQGTTWTNYYDAAGNEVSVTAAIMNAAAAGGYNITLDPADFSGVSFIKLRSGTSGTPVNQTASRALVVYARKFYPNY
jgi:hypothetical protein